MRRRWWALGVLVTLLLLAAGGAYLVAAVLVYDQVSRVEPDCAGAYLGNTPASWSPPAWAREPAAGFDLVPLFVADFEDVRLPSRDAGIELHGWWLPAASGPDTPAVIVVHGRGACVRHHESLAPAGMLHRQGYAVLLIDLRDHGSSTIEDGRYAGGTEEYRDVIGAVDWLMARGVEPGRVGVLGTSLGAATAIIAAGQDDRIGGVWADSSFADIERRIAEELEAKGYPRLLAPAATLVARLVSGDDLAAHTVLGEIPNLEGRHLSIVHGELDDATDVSHAWDLLAAADAAGVGVDAWIVPGSGHVQAMFREQDEYERRLDAFFEVALG